MTAAVPTVAPVVAPRAARLAIPVRRDWDSSDHDTVPVKVACVVVGDLAVHRLIDKAHGPWDIGRRLRRGTGAVGWYEVTHIRSGRAFGWLVWEDLDTAVRVAQAMTARADWSIPFPDVKRESETPHRRALCLALQDAGQHDMCPYKGHHIEQ